MQTRDLLFFTGLGVERLIFETVPNECQFEESTGREQHAVSPVEPLGDAELLVVGRNGTHNAARCTAQDSREGDDAHPHRHGVPRGELVDPNIGVWCENSLSCATHGPSQD